MNRWFFALIVVTFAATAVGAPAVVPLARIDELDGSPTAPAVGPVRWRQALHELRLAAVAGWPTPAQARAVAHDLARRGGTIPIAVLDVKGPVFAASALIDRTYHGREVHFVVPRAWYVTDGVAAATRVAVDLDDGAGWREVAFDVPIVARYAATGERRVDVRVTREDGSSAWGSFPFTVVARDVPPPTEIWPLVADIAYDGAVATGEAFVYLAEGHATLTRPLVVVEGFDFNDTMGWDVLYTLLNQENLLEDLRADGYDAVVLNFASATEPIQRNAYLLTTLLQRVQSSIDADLAYPVIGASMGGLVSRYALAYMEQSGLPHRVRTWVSFDSPHTGANIPLGVQYWLDFFQDESDEAAYLLGRLDTPGARQMLLYHHTTPPSPAAQPDPLRAIFLADLAALGDYPTQPRRVAVANGSGHGQDQGFAPGDQIVQWEYSSFLVDIVGNIWAVPDESSRIILDAEIDLIWPLPDEALTVTVSGTLPWDSAPGGSRSTMAEMELVDAPYGDIVALHPSHAFIPTVSALALADVGPFHDIAGDPDLLSRTPFDVVHFPVENQEHVLITAESRQWFLDALNDPLTPVGAPIAAGVSVTCAPNPFNPRTTFTFDLPAAQRVRLEVFDPRGRRVATLVDGDLEAGRHAAVWDGRDGTGRAAAAGAYVYRLTGAGEVASGSVTMVR